MKSVTCIKRLTPLTVIAALAMSGSPLLAYAAGADINAGKAQGGDAPATARDPHAYSDGYTLENGPYALGGPRQLRLADEHRFWTVQADRVEYDADTEAAAFDLRGWYGTTYDRLYFNVEGDVANGRLEESQTAVGWSHAYSAYFDTQLGIRLDQYTEGADRQWLAAGVEGLAPYWFDVSINAYLGDSGRTAMALDADYELLLSQRWVLQPSAGLSLYGQDDVENGLGEGFSNAALGLRLRYEITRQFAPYVGIEWTRKLGQTADMARAAGDAVRDTAYVVGVRFWF
ncbi:MAG: copper resistance protein B [Motiliproteus sp.]|jgi:copper resistance protein B